ncbi:MAG TPA: hypothetical protein VNZ86_13605 [Bacteroidia bacterium]|jgi:hypothetical protein|nr:hypothetical protein [Bacteroidia bacterium]
MAAPQFKQIQKQSVSNILQIFIGNSSVTTGAGLTGLTSATSGLIAYFMPDTVLSPTAITLTTMTLGVYTSGGFAEIDATHMPGYYQFCPPNAAFSTGNLGCVIMLSGAANMQSTPIDIAYLGYSPLGTEIPANVVKINGSFTNGPNATLSLRQLNIVNSTGDAIIASSTGSNGNGINASGNGSGSGVLSSGGSTGQGIVAAGGATSGSGIYAYAAGGGDGMHLVGASNGNGINAAGNGSGNGVLGVGGGTGGGISGVGGATSGSGIFGTATGNGAGMSLTGVGQSSLSADQGISGPTAGLFDANTKNAIADSALIRDWTATTVAVGQPASRSTMNALRPLRNGFTISGSTISYLEEDGITTAWQSTATTSGTAQLIVDNVGS